MALGNKKTPRKFIKGRNTGLITEPLLTEASSSMAGDIFSQDPVYSEGVLSPILYQMDLMHEDIDELRRHVTEDINGGGGGGLTETPLAMISARWMWSNTDSGERVFSGTTSYGPFGYFSFATEPWNSTLRIYDSRQVVDTATSTAYAYEMPFYGVWCPNNGKKVKAKFSFRVQNSPAATGSTWGISLWSASDSSSGTTTSDGASTVTLRAKSPDISVTTSSNTYWTTTCTTTSNMNDVWVLPLIENRSGTLTTTTYVYGQIALYLV